MKRKCPWCRGLYDTSNGQSSVWCDRNPRRGHKKMKPRLVSIAVMPLAPSPFWKSDRNRRPEQAG